MGSSVVAVAQPTDNSSEIVMSLQRISTPIIQRKMRRVVESITLLRKLYNTNTSVYRAACHAWLEDVLDVCNLLDSSGISAMVADYAKFLLSQGFSFDIAIQSSSLAPTLVTQTQECANVTQEFATILKKEWEVPDTKYSRFWPYIDQSVKALFAPPLPTPSSQFLIEPAVRRVFNMLDQEDAFEDWEHLKWNWKVFYSNAIMNCGAMVGGAGIGGVAVTVAAGIVAPPIVLIGGGVLLLVAGSAGLARQ